MSRQIAIGCAGPDLELILEALRRDGGIELLSDCPTSKDTALLPLAGNPVANAPSNLGLLCFLAPTRLPRPLLLRRLSSVKIAVDEQINDLIEFSVPAFDGKNLRRGRAYYQDVYEDRNGENLKSAAFCAWADQVFKLLKTTLRLDRQKGIYVGPHAAQLLASGSTTYQAN